MDKEALEALQNNQISAALQACEDMEQFSYKLKPVIHNLQKLSREIIEHLAHGDVTDQKRNSELWHGLNNIEHQINQLSLFIKEFGQELPLETGKLISVLQSVRPPKE